MDVIDSGWFTEAKKTRELEKQFAEFVGRKYAVVTTSGTTALFLALKALGLEQNDEVIVPDLTFVASPNSVDLAGGKVSLVDINKKDLGLDLKKTEQLITSKTKELNKKIALLETELYFCHRNYTIENEVKKGLNDR